LEPAACRLRRGPRMRFRESQAPDRQGRTDARTEQTSIETVARPDPELWRRDHPFPPLADEQYAYLGVVGLVAALALAAVFWQRS
jgi:hypothetical protein